MITGSLNPSLDRPVYRRDDPSISPLVVVLIAIEALDLCLASFRLHLPSEQSLDVAQVGV
jgi:hypothetical protein